MIYAVAIPMPRDCWLGMHRTDCMGGEPDRPVASIGNPYAIRDCPNWDMSGEISTSSGRPLPNDLGHMLNQSGTSYESGESPTSAANSRTTTSDNDGRPLSYKGRIRSEAHIRSRQAVLRQAPNNLDERTALDEALGGGLGKSAVAKVIELNDVDVVLQELRALKAFGQADADAYHRALAICVANKDVETAQHLFVEMRSSGMKSCESIQLMVMLRNGLVPRPSVDDDNQADTFVDTPSPSPERLSNQLLQPRVAIGVAGELLQLPHQAIAMQPHLFSSNGVVSPPSTPEPEPQKPMGQHARTIHYGEQLEAANFTNHQRPLHELLGFDEEPAGNHEQTPLHPPGQFVASSANRFEEKCLNPNFFEKIVYDSDSDLESITAECQQQFAWQQRSESQQLQSGPSLEFKSKLLDKQGRLTSIGSMRHYEGTFNPCVLKNSIAGRKAGTHRANCHFDHTDTNLKLRKGKPCKGQRDRRKKLIARLAHEIAVDPMGFDIEKAVFPPSFLNNEKAKDKVKQQMLTLQKHAISVMQRDAESDKDRRI